MRTIAVVGTGIAGIGAAVSLARGCVVELFEAEPEAGGHARTVDHGSLALDTGFIVHNEVNYPQLVGLFRELGVSTQESLMSFSVECSCGVTWSSRRAWRAGPSLLREVTRFLRTAGDADTEGKTLDRFLHDERYSDSLRWHYLVPLCSALWSKAPGQALELPARWVIGFLSNHGMLGFRRHRWRTVVGGSRSYVRAALARIDGAVHTGLPVRAIERGDGVTVVTDDGNRRRFDGVVVATPAPEALRLLAAPSPDERRLLSAFRTTRNETTLHTDSRFLPRRGGDRSAWNYQSAGCGVDAPLPTITYSLNRLQRLEATEEYCVTLNRTEEVDPRRVITVFDDAHPQVTFESLAAQVELPLLNGHLGTAFAGAWQGYGFHEDGLVSGVRAARSLGARAAA